MVIENTKPRRESQKQSEDADGVHALPLTSSASYVKKNRNDPIYPTDSVFFIKMKQSC